MFSRSRCGSLVTSVALKMWNHLRQRCLIVIPLLCVLSFGLANALHGYANAEGQPPDMLATLPGQLKFVHVVRVSLVLVESPCYIGFMLCRYIATATERPWIRIPRIPGVRGSSGPPAGVS